MSLPRARPIRTAASQPDFNVKLFAGLSSAPSCDIVKETVDPLTIPRRLVVGKPKEHL
eukprot:CAMPEP_0172842900 /NCGR_PEP_ID=MMETSP1075-20121228/31073_1 /TAXON_ID=2916 /ORGANISM="Ceratium fusus, Strain PA161109" /LENGTH=57 /DNA_ID=CAMNT_0013687087 /DNA_START=22 /DNA_END=192 /DNA_ORIENTATION=-